MLRKFACVQIPAWEQEWPIDAGVKRYRYNAGHVRDRGEYADKEVLQPELTANIASCLCEYAASKHYNQSWNGPYWRPQYHSIAKAAPDFGNDGSVRRTRTFPGGRMSVLDTDMQHNWLLVQAFIPDVVLFPLVERFAKGLPPLDADVHVWLLGQVRAPMAWSRGYFLDNSNGAKKWCDPVHLEAVAVDHNPLNMEPPPPPPLQTRTDVDLLRQHCARLAALGFSDAVTTFHAKKEQQYADSHA